MKTSPTDINRLLPRTAVELARILKASRPEAAKDAVSGHFPRNGRRAGFCDAAVTYAPDRGSVALKRNLAGALVDIRA